MGFFMHQHRVHQTKSGVKQKVNQRKTPKSANKDIRYNNPVGAAALAVELKRAKESAHSLYYKLTDGYRSTLPGDILGNAQRLLHEANNRKILTGRNREGNYNEDLGARAKYLRTTRDQLAEVLPKQFTIKKVGSGKESRLIILEGKETIYDPGVNGKGRVNPDYSRYESNPSLQRAD
jgi:hypothetical protein